MKTENQQKQEIRATLTRLLNHFEKLMQLGYYPRTMRNIEAVSKLRKLLEFRVNASLAAHHRLLISEAETIKLLMPSGLSKYQKLRAEVMALVVMGEQQQHLLQHRKVFVAHLKPSTI